jgi:hypothetical protein
MYSDQKFDVEFSVEIHVLRSPESKETIFSKWSVCVCVCMCVCMSVNRLSEKLRLLERPNLEHQLLVISRCDSKVLVKIGQPEVPLYSCDFLIFRDLFENRSNDFF